MPLGAGCGVTSAAGHQPASDPFGNLRGGSFRNFGGILAVTANEKPSSYRLADEFDAMRLAASLLQADADVGLKSRHEFGFIT